MPMSQSCVLHCVLSLSPPVVAHLSLLTPLSVSVPGFAGTPGYLSPEVLRKEAYGKPVDIWACGKSQFLPSPCLVPAPSLPPSRTRTWSQSRTLPRPCPIPTPISTLIPAQSLPDACPIPSYSLSSPILILSHSHSGTFLAPF